MKQMFQQGSFLSSDQKMNLIEFISQELYQLPYAEIGASLQQ